MPKAIEFKAGDLSQGEVRLLDWVGKKFGADERYTTASAIEYYGNVKPDSEGFHGVKSRIAHLMTEKLSNAGMIMAGSGVLAYPAMGAMLVAGMAAAPAIAVGIAGAAVGAVGVGIAHFSASIAEKLAERRMKATLDEPKPSASPMKLGS